MSDPEGTEFLRGIRDALRAQRLAEGRPLPRRTGKVRKGEDAPDTANTPDQFWRKPEAH